MSQLDDASQPGKSILPHDAAHSPAPAPPLPPLQFSDAHLGEAPLALAIDAAGIGIWVWDFVHPERSYGSENLSKIHGITPCPKEQALQLFFSALHPDDRGQLEELFARCVRGEASNFAIETRLFWPDGSLHWVEVRGYVVQDAARQPTHLTGILQEITRRKEADAQLEQQRQALLRHARMMEQTERLGEIGGWEWDIAGAIYYFTPQTYRIFGLSPESYTPGPTGALDFFRPASASILESALRRASEFGEDFDLKLEVVNAQGATLWVRVAGCAEMVNGAVVRVYGSIQDITLRTQIEAQLNEAQKLESIGQLAGGIAHDFNNLLTAISGMSELALRRLDKVTPTPDLERVRTYITEIQRAGGRAATLTRQLLAFGRKQVLRPKVLDLRAEVMKAQDLLRQSLGPKVELVLNVPSRLGLVMADPNQIEQVIIHLGINARDAMPNGGVLTIRLLNTTVDESSARPKGKLPPGNYVVLEMQDSGHGMTPEVQARLFDPFFTTKAIGEGSGLGLATVYGIVKQSGGAIEVESEVGVGSIFRIFLPQSTSPVQEAKAAPSQVRGGTETILLVGDDAWARQGYRVALEAKGYHVLEAADGRATIALCQGYVGAIHLLVVSAPHDMSGVALTHQAQLSRPELRVLLLEDGQQGKVAMDAIEPSYFLLNHPFTPDQLVAKVRSVLDTPGSVPML